MQKTDLTIEFCKWLITISKYKEEDAWHKIIDFVIKNVQTPSYAAIAR